MESKNLLYDIEAERNVIGSLLVYAKAMDDLRDILNVETFSEPLHKEIYTVALLLAERGEAIDIISATNELRRTGKCGDLTPYEVTTLSGCASPNYYYSAQILFELSARRRLWEVGQRLISRAVDLTFDLGATVEEVTTALGHIFSTPASHIVTLREATVDLYENYIKRNLSGESELTGAPTGFEPFDEKSGGLHPGNLLVVAAETSQGKTSFALSAAIAAAKEEYGVAVYSMEMGNAELAARIAAVESGLGVNRILYTKLQPGELTAFQNSTGKVLGLPIYFDDSSTSNIDVIISSIRTMVVRHRIKGVVIDYLQILNVNMKTANKEQQMAEVARRLKNLAKDLGIWIIALSQLSRDNVNRVPTLNRLRDSGQIAEAADIVILLYRPEVYNLRFPEPYRGVPVEGKALVHVAKGRNIGLLKFLTGFDASSTYFYNLSEQPAEDPEAEEETPEELF